MHAPATPAPSSQFATAPSAWLLLLLLLPALPYALDLPSFGALQYNDYYGIVAQVLDGSAFTTDPARWLGIKSNEHTVTLPALVYAANYGLTAGDNRGLSALSILLVLLGAALIWARTCRLQAWGHVGNALAALVIAGLAFSPAMAHSLVMGFSGTIWLLANLFAFAAITLLSRASRPTWWRLAGVVGCGWLGALTYTTSMSLWPAVLLGGAMLRIGWRRWLVLGAAAAAVVAFQWLLRAPRPPGHPVLNTDAWRLGFQYVSLYMGWPIVTDIGRAMLLGGAGLVAFALVLFLAWFPRFAAARPMVALGLMLAVYGLGNAIGTAIGRSNFGIEHARSSRYVSLAMSFWIGLCIAALPMLRALGGGFALRRWPVPVSALVGTTIAVAMVAATWVCGEPVYRHYLDQAARQRLGAQAMLHLDFSEPTILDAINCAPEQMAICAGWLHDLRHVPYQLPQQCRDLTAIDARRVTAQLDAGVIGHFDGLVPVRPELYRVEAWAQAATEIVEAVVLDEAGVVRGQLVCGLPRRDVVKVHGPGALYTGIGGYAHVPAGSMVAVLIRLAGKDCFQALPGQRPPALLGTLSDEVRR